MMRRFLSMKRFVTLLLAVCGVFFMVACDNSDKGDAFEVPIESLNAGNRGSSIVGEFIKCAEVSPAAAEPLINDQGMSGMRAPNHLHNTQVDFSYKSAEKGAIVFTLPQVESLGYMYIWNYNGDGNVKNGLKDVRIEYSVDNENWYTIDDGKYKLAKALKDENEKYGGNAANNLDDDRKPIDFKGVSAKYIRIVPLSNYGGDGYGLSEVRFFRYKTRPGAGSILPVTANAPLSNVKDASMLVNNMGLSDLHSATATHNNEPSAMWYADSDMASDAMIVLNLDGNYPLEKLVIWNYNDPAQLDRGMQKIKVEYTSKSPNSINDGIIDYKGGDWTILDTYTVEKGTGEEQLTPSLTVELNNIHAQHIRITPESNYGGEGFGLSAIRLFAGSGWAVEPAREWTGLFSTEGSFPYQLSGQNPRAGYGWLSADGVYSVHMNGSDMHGSATDESKTMFLFSDTGIGNFKNYSGEYGKHGDNMFNGDMRNHTMATLDGNKPDPRNLQFYLHAGSGYGNIFDRVSWAQELVRIDDKLYSFAMRFSGWEPYQYDLVQFDIKEGYPDLSKKPEVDDAFPIKIKDGIYNYDFSAAVLDNTESGGASESPDGYIYIYGMLSWNDGFWLQKAPVVARSTPEEFADRGQWRFWNGTDWASSIKEVANINANGADVSSEYSVSYMNEGPFKGKYMMTYTKDTMFNEMCFRVADTPYGPFGDATTLYYSPDVYTILENTGVNDIYTYNGKAHPHLSAEGELLMSYNVNSRSYKTAMEYLHPQFLNMFEIE